MSESLLVAPEPADLVRLESLWAGELSTLYDGYRHLAGPGVALAAALVELAMRLQNLGGPAAGAADLLIADLCLARASRLLAETGDQVLQAGFARAIERLAADAATEGRQLQPVRELLTAAIGTAE